MSSTVKVKFEPGKVLKELEKLKKMSVTVGYAGEKGAKKVKGSDYTIGEYANVMDKGTRDGSTPARPFFREALIFPDGRAILDEAIADGIALIISGQLNAKQFYSKLGSFAKRQVIKSIKTGSFTPLKAATIKAKGKDKMLIDTGDMLGAVEFEVNDE